MFVSTRAATLVEILPGPDSVLRRFAPPPTSADPAICLVEELQSLFDRQWLALPGGVDPDGIAGCLEFNLVPGSDAVPLGNRLGHGHLELARHLGHILTLARIISLIYRFLTDRLRRE